jgi:hypothetical protein
MADVLVFPDLVTLSCRVILQNAIDTGMAFYCLYV